MFHIEIPNLKIAWDEGLQCILMEWTGFVYGPDLKKAVNQGLDLLVEQKGRKWLADLSKMEVIAQDDQRWVDQEWFPMAAKAGVKYIAMIRPLKVISQMSVRTATHKAGELEIETSYFDSLESAREWLKSRD